jgi:hypothetical protein
VGSKRKAPMRYYSKKTEKLRKSKNKKLKKPNREKKAIKILKKPTGSIRFLSLKRKKPNRTQIGKNERKPSQTSLNRFSKKPNRTKTGLFELVSVFFKKKFNLITFFLYKN